MRLPRAALSVAVNSQPGRAGHRQRFRACLSLPFGAARVSTTGQTTENQFQEIEAAGFKVDPRRFVSETVSGSSAIEQRPGFIKLLSKLEQDDVLIVTKLDRLGRNATDVATTVARLAEMGVRVSLPGAGRGRSHKPRGPHDDGRHQRGCTV
jgi:Resolvase, N terminal domain